MPTSSYQVGDGITAETRRRTSLDEFTLDEMREIGQALLDMPERLNKVWGTKAPLIQALRARLVELKAQAPDLTDYEASAAFFAARKTEAWFVLTAVKFAKHVERCIEEGRSWETVSFAFDIGQLVTEYGFKRDWEAPALTGQKIRDSLREGPKARRKGSIEERYRAVVKYLNDGQKLPDAFRSAADALGVSESAARNGYYDFKKDSKLGRLE